MIYKKFAEANNLTAEKRSIYGNYKGYFISIQAQMQFTRVFIAAHIKDNAEVAEKLALTVKTSFRLAVQNFKIENYGVDIVINTVIQKILVNGLDATIAVLTESGIKGEGFCPMCGEALDASDSVKVKFGDAVLYVHNGCVAEYDKQIETELQMAEEIDKAEDRNYIKGVIGALLGGIVGFIPWIILYLIGIVSAYAAVLIGVGANFGYKLLGGKSTNVKYPIIIVATVISLVMALVIGFCIELYIIAQSEGVTISLFDTPNMFINLLNTEPEYSAAVVAVVLQSALFAVIGMVGYFIYLIGKEKKMSRRQSQRMD